MNRVFNRKITLKPIIEKQNPLLGKELKWIIPTFKVNQFNLGNQRLILYLKKETKILFKKMIRANTNNQSLRRSKDK